VPDADLRHTDDADPADFDFRPPRSGAPLVVGAVIAIMITVAAISIVHMSARSGCPASGCVPLSTPSTRLADVTAAPSVKVATPTATVARETAQLRLSDVMPADVSLPACRTTDDVPFSDEVTAYFACREGATAQLAYLQVWGYQFPNAAAYERGVDAFNAFVKFDPTAAEGKCPPAATYGSVGWHTLAKPGVEAGLLECYSDSSENHYYVWTDDAEYTIVVAESSPEQTFGELDAWWRQNNRNA
jgi:hypothetical protein